MSVLYGTICLAANLGCRFYLIDAAGSGSYRVSAGGGWWDV